jgi:hypothetical protein
MKLEDQVVSLALGKTLKNLGVKQNSEFYWRLSYSVSETLKKGVVVKRKGNFGDYRLEHYPKPRYSTADLKWNESDLSKLDNTEVSAFTVGEILQMLPASIFFPKTDEMYYLELYKNDTKLESLKLFKGWRVFYEEDEEQVPEGRQLKFLGPKDYFHENLANAGAKVLIYLIKKGYVKL